MRRAWSPCSNRSIFHPRSSNWPCRIQRTARDGGLSRRKCRARRVPKICSRGNLIVPYPATCAVIRGSGALRDHHAHAAQRRHAAQSRRARARQRGQCGRRYLQPHVCNGQGMAQNLPTNPRSESRRTRWSSISGGRASTPWKRPMPSTRAGRMRLSARPHGRTGSGPSEVRRTGDLPARRIATRIPPRPTSGRICDAAQ